MDAIKLVSELGGRWLGSYGKAPCPAHDDRRPSLSVSQSSDGQILWKCHAGCSQEAIARALRKRGLINGHSQGSKLRKVQPRVVATYDYKGPDGQLLFQVVKYAPKSFKQRRPDGKGGFIWNLKDIEQVPYRLPALVQAGNEPVFIVEGEKDADRLTELGLLATCNSGGAGKWKKSYNVYFARKNVVILPDNDQAGRKHALSVAKNLNGVAAQIKVVKLPELKAKSDVSDWLSSGGSLARLKQICDASPVWPLAPQDSSSEDPPSGALSSDQSEPDSVDEEVLVLKPSAPLPTAKTFVQEKYDHGDCSTLVHFAGLFRAWNGRCYSAIDPQEIRADLYEFLENAYRINFKTGQLVPFDPTTKKVNDVIDALRAVTNLPLDTPVPGWLSNEAVPDMTFPPNELVAFKNGLLHLPSGDLQPPTPLFFSFNALDYGYDPNIGARPSKWLGFLSELWPEDQESIDTLQEIFGYLLTADTRQQKIFMIVGPKRSGKGTIAHVLTAMLGKANVCAPTLSSLTERFGLAPLIGKQAAIIGDARLGSRSDQVSIGERLLSISGEDSITVDRKHIGAWTGNLPTRFLLLTNELPRFADASGALASRLIILTLTNSFYGKEDIGLRERLLGELPSIFNWAVQGWKRLRERGHFVQPHASIELERELEDLSSPIGAFLRDCCDVDPHGEVAIDQLYQTYREWCEGQGRKPSTKHTFGRDLRAVIPPLRVSQHDTDSKKGQRFYKGLSLRAA